MKMGLFTSRAEKERLSHVKTLLALALADGHLADNEIEAIATVAARENVDVKEVEKMLAGKDKVSFVVPQSDEEKFNQLRDLVVLMMIDGQINEKELALCKAVANHYGFAEDAVENLAMAILKEFKENS